jgi:hypothetical protein
VRNPGRIAGGYQEVQPYFPTKGTKRHGP